MRKGEAQQPLPSRYRWLPRSLNGQLILFTASSLAVAILTYASYATSRQTEMALSTVTLQMSALARNLAGASVSHVLTGDLAEIEKSILDAADFPPVISALLVDAHGKPLGEALNENGKIRLHYSQNKVALPTGHAAVVEGADIPFNSFQMILRPRAAMTIWHPIFGGDLLGWVRITYSLEKTGAIILRAWVDALLISLLAISTAIALLTFLIKLPMRTLKEATLFAEGLDRNLGGKLPVSDVAVEFEALGTALNSVSLRLKSQDNQLQENARFTQHILDHVIDGIITIDSHGTVLSFNTSASNIFGYTAEEVIGDNVNMLMTEPYRSDHDGYLANYRQTGQPHIIGKQREVPGRRKDGTSFPMDLAVSSGAHLGQPLFIGIVRDITERKRIDKIKSEFISTVSHELRTPLTSIRGSLAMIVGGVVGELPTKVKPLIEIAHKNSERLILLVNDILDMEKIESGKLECDFQPTSLMSLLRQAMEANHAYAEQFNVGFELESELPGAMVYADENRLLQVFANLLSNAAKFSLTGARVRVGVEHIDRQFRVTVSNRGPGIPDEFKDRIFQRFAQADSSDTRKKGGTGLGLSITKAIVELMGGRIGFDSQPNVLTKFYVEFPEYTKG